MVLRVDGFVRWNYEQTSNKPKARYPTWKTGFIISNYAFLILDCIKGERCFWAYPIANTLTCTVH
jgi:hypothetical protein